MARRRLARWLRTSIWADRLLAAIALIPLCVLVVRQFLELGNDTVPCCDFAALELGTRAFLRGEQFVGLYSREGWRHPGPATFLWSSLFRPLPGQSFAEHQVAMSVLSLSALSAVIIGTWRHVTAASRSLVIVLVAVFIARFGVDAMRVPWNPYAASMWTLIAVIGTAVFCQRRTPWTAGIAVFAGSMAAQSHVGAAPTVVVCLLVIGVVLIRSRHRRDVSRTIWPAAVVFAAMWFLPAADLAFANRNLVKILDPSSSSTVGMDRSDVLTGAMWLAGHSPGRIGETFGPASPFIEVRNVIWLDIVAIVVVGALVLGAVLLRRRDRFVGDLAGITLVSLGVTVFALLVSDGPFLLYLLLPIAGLGLMLWIAAGATSIRLLQRHEHNALRLLAWPVVIALSTVSILGIDSGNFTDDYDSEETVIIVDQIRDECQDLPARSVVEVTDDVEWFDALTILVPIERCSALRVLGHIGFLAGQPYRAPDGSVANVVIAGGDEAPAGRVIASSGTLSVVLVDS